VIGYYETEHPSHQAAIDAIVNTEVNIRWQTMMAQFTCTEQRPDEGTQPLGLILHLGAGDHSTEVETSMKRRCFSLETSIFT
jgi:hypothetical protein